MISDFFYQPSSMYLKSNCYSYKPFYSKKTSILYMVNHYYLNNPSLLLPASTLNTYVISKSQINTVFFINNYFEYTWKGKCTWEYTYYYKNFLNEEYIYFLKKYYLIPCEQFDNINVIQKSQLNCYDGSIFDRFTEPFFETIINDKLLFKIGYVHDITSQSF